MNVLLLYHRPEFLDLPAQAIECYTDLISVPGKSTSAKPLLVCTVSIALLISGSGSSFRSYPTLTFMSIYYILYTLWFSVLSNSSLLSVLVFLLSVKHRNSSSHDSHYAWSCMITGIYRRVHVATFLQHLPATNTRRLAESMSLPAGFYFRKSRSLSCDQGKIQWKFIVSKSPARLYQSLLCGIHIKEMLE